MARVWIILCVAVFVNGMQIVMAETDSNPPAPAPVARPLYPHVSSFTGRCNLESAEACASRGFRTNCSTFENQGASCVPQGEVDPAGNRSCACVK